MTPVLSVSKRLRIAAVVSALAVLGALPVTPKPTPTAPTASPTWVEVDDLVAKQKLEEASRKVDAILQSARARGDSADWTKALIRSVQLRTGLHGYETAVRYLKTESWPPDLLSRTALDLFYAQSLMTYARMYSYEIGQRERVESTGTVDLKAWTREQIYDEAVRAYVALWDAREALGRDSVAALSEFMEPNTYPPGIRSTLRDALAYFFAALLADTSGWSPAQSNAVFALDLAGLLRANAVSTADVRLGDPAVHPLERLTAVLADLEGWHAGRKEREAAFEARLERLRRLHAAFTQPEDQASIEKDLEARLPAMADLPWYAMGQFELAGFLRGAGDRGDLVRARAAADEGWRAFPDSPGGRRCLWLVRQIEAPLYRLEAMRADGPERRSILVTHKNVDRLIFRAFSVDLPARVAAAKDISQILPQDKEMADALSGTPAAEWTVALPATPDYRNHRTYVVPPLRNKGLYVVAASPGERFGETPLPVVATSFLVSDLVLILPSSAERHADGTERLEVRAMWGKGGAAAEGASVALLRGFWNPRHVERVAEGRSDAHGEVSLQTREENPPAWGNRFLYARRGEDLAYDTGVPYGMAEPNRKVAASLVFTDRSIYRPGQTILWKVLAYRGDPTAGRFEVSPNAPITVTLVDGNNQIVATRSATTNEFGSAAGDFAIPSGRALGSWRVETSLSGSSWVRVEEYKRPTFEVTLKDPAEPLRLNRPARLTGEARYYFGLPVATGVVRWHVTRTPRYPWWAWWYGWGGGEAAETVAIGSSTLQADGTFTLAFTPKADERIAKDRTGTTYSYDVQADASDEGGETRSASRAFRLGFTAVEARFEMPQAFLREGVVGRVEVVRTTLDGVPRAGEARWRLVKLAQPPAPILPAEEPTAPDPNEPSGELRTPGDLLRPRWQVDYSPERSLARWKDGAEVARGTLTHDAKGVAAIALPRLEPGAYRIHYATRDEFGAEFEAPKDIVVAGDKTSVALPALLMAEAASVPVGGTARLLALSGIAGQPMTLEIDRDGRPVERRDLMAGRSTDLIEIPIREKDRGGFGVRLTVLRDFQLITLTQAVFVPWDDKDLDVRFATFRDRLRPGQKETWTVKVSGPGGSSLEPRAAELLAYMYDRSLDAFAPHQAPDPLHLYPSHTAVAWSRASLGENGFAWIRGEFPRIPGWGAFAGDSLKQYNRYGIGGPGVRGGLVGGVASEITVSGEAPLIDSTSTTIGNAAPKAPAARAEMAVAKNAAVAPAESPVALRSRFAETAFWKPHLITGPDGSASIEFEVPDSVTSWSVWVHAVTRDLKAGSVHRETKSVKELMVRPYVPRFLREGDAAALKVVVNNASEHGLAGNVTLDILDSATNASALAEFGLSKETATLPFSAAASAGSEVTFRLTAPRRAGAYAIKATAASGAFSDGELRPVPVLPSRMELSQSRFAALRGGERRTLSFADLARNDDPSRIDEQLVVTVDGQLFYSVLSALPYLVNYPYECIEQTLNRFVSTGIVSSVFRDYPAVATMAKSMSKRDTRLEPWDAADPNRRMALEETPWLQTAQGGKPGEDLVRVLDPKIANADREASIAKLRQAQTDSGGFPWWPGGPPSTFMTLYVLDGFSRVLEFKGEAPRDMVQAGWKFAAADVKSDIDRCVHLGLVCEFATYVNYILSSYPDESWYAPSFDASYRKVLLDYSFAHWKEHSPRLKGQLALTLQRMGRPADAKLVWDAVMDSAKTDRDLGTHFAPEDRSWLWYNDTIETQAFALRVLAELDPADSRRHGMVQWLFLNKKLNQWKSTRATAEVIYSLVWYLRKEGALAESEDVTVDVASQRTTFTFEPDRYTGRRNQVVVPGEKIDPRRDAEIGLAKTGKGLAFASATWNFSTERLPDEDRGDFFAVSRRYFRREATPSGFVLRPLTEGTPVSPGDEIEVQISLRSKHAAEYVHLRDPRPAGAEPENVLSRWKWDLGISWYEETRDSGADFFFERLPVGEYTFKHRIRANMGGVFRVAPATVQSMYAPEFNAYSAGATIQVK